MARDPTDLSECSACACFAVRRAARAITQHYDRALRPSGLRATQFTLLTILALGGPQPLGRVADRLGMERTTLTRNLRPLTAGGLVAVRSTHDRRVRTVAITSKGQRKAAAALPHWRNAQRALADYLPSGLLASLETAAHGLRASTPASRRPHSQL